MNANFPYNGVVVPLTTPFTTEGHIDVKAVHRIVDRIARHHLGVFALGTTGETASIPRPERLEFVEAVMEAAKGRIPVYAGIGDNCLSNSLLAARHYLGLGVKAVVAHLPSYYPLTPHEMQAYFELLHANLDGPLLVYNIPATTRMSIPIEVVKNLAELPNCVGFKDSENSPGRMEAVYEALGGQEDFALFMGSAVLSHASLKLGYVGLVPSTGNLVPHLWEELWNACTTGNWSEGELLQNQLDEISVIFQEGRTLGQSLAVLKAALSFIGLCEPLVLPPLHTLSQNEQRITRDKLLSLCPFLNDEVKALHGNRR